MGCKIIIHNQRNESPCWFNHGSRGFYVGPAIKHYRNYVCFMSKSKALQIVNTVDFFSITCADPTMTAAERLSLIMTDLLAILKAPPTPSRIFNSQRKLATAITTLQSILGGDNSTHYSTTTATNLYTNHPNHHQHQRSIDQWKPINLYPIGTIIRKYNINASSFHEDEITSYNAINNLYHVKYLQSDREEFTYGEIRKQRKTTQKHTKIKQPKTMSHGLKRKFNNSVFFIPTKASPNPVKQDYMRKNHAYLLHQQHKKYVKVTHSVLAGAVWDEELERWHHVKNLLHIVTISFVTDGLMEVKTNLVTSSKDFPPTVSMD